MKNDDGDMGEPMLTAPAIVRQPLPPVVLECERLRARLAEVEAENKRLHKAGTDTWAELRTQIHTAERELDEAQRLICATYGALTPDGCDLPPSGINTMPDKVRALHEVAGWAQAVLTALNVGDVKSGSPLHLKLRSVMIAYRATKNTDQVPTEHTDDTEAGSANGAGGNRP